MTADASERITEVPSTGRVLSLRGVRTNCLKNISLDLPLRQWISVVGVSGAGKTSLARDTIVAEAHRRYLESLSLSARQYLDRVERPDADRIDGLPPCLSLGAQSLPVGPRNTLASTLGLQDLLAGIFARLGTAHCPSCGTIVRGGGAAEWGKRIATEWPRRSRLQLGFMTRDRAEVERKGFSRFFAMAGVGKSPAGEFCCVDRIALPEGAGDAELTARITESIGICQRERGAEGECVVLTDTRPEGEASFPVQLDEREWMWVLAGRDPVCSACGHVCVEPEARLFRFQSPLGACAECSGTGRARTSPRGGRGMRKKREICGTCQGKRLRGEARSVRFRGVSIDEVTTWNGRQVRGWLEPGEGAWNEEERESVRPAIEELQRRCGILEELGLEGLPWERGTSELSLGERERLSIASLLTARMVHALYLLDEPTRGLHPLDRIRLILALRTLRARSNSLVVVEHDELFLREADWVVELGPGSGEQGGEVMYAGNGKTFLDIKGSEFEMLGKLSKGGEGASEKRRDPAGGVALRRAGNAGEVEFPLGVLCVLTGVSGSGKSRLMSELGEGVEGFLEGDRGGCLEFRGNPVDELIAMDERSVPLTSHSTPATLLQVWGGIRQQFAATDEAWRRNFDAKSFGLSSDHGGRCPTCAGRGYQLVDLQFLPDAKMTCPDCRGTRYLPELLEVTYRGLNIAEVLGLSIVQALTHFRGENQILRKLTSAVGLGLESLKLGQAASGLSAGELQRLKLALHLGRRSGKRTLFLLDEPTSGLHPRDVGRIVESLEQLVSAGQSVIAIDHHPLLLCRADEILDLGRVGGRERGEVVARGSLAEVGGHPESATQGTLGLVNL